MKDSFSIRKMTEQKSNYCTIYYKALVISLVKTYFHNEVLTVR